MKVLGIETSCDETACSIIDEKNKVLSSVIYSQIEMHNKFGGIVPELASRDHALKIEDVVQSALQQAGLKAGDITHVGVTTGPGLLGCLLVGIAFGKAFAMARDIPLIEVDHIKAHVLAVFIKESEQDLTPEFPFIGLVVSGGHTTIYLAESYESIKPVASTVDDAAGEVFDKVARFLGLGYPGGKIVSDIARKGDPTKIKFPKPVVKGREHDFSFSGLKTSAINYFKGLSTDGNFNVQNPDIVNGLAGFQEAVCGILVEKLLEAAEKYKVKDIVIGGGVASNYRLRELLTEQATKKGFKPWLVPIKYCTDNAAMIANLAKLSGDKYPNSFTDDMAKLAAYSTTRR